MTADTCPTCKEKDDQIAVLVEALDKLFDYVMVQEGGFKGDYIKLANRIDALLGDLPAAARERAEEREQLREALEELMAGFSHGGAKVECPCVACKQGRAVLVGEKANR